MRKHLSQVAGWSRRQRNPSAHPGLLYERYVDFTYPDEARDWNPDKGAVVRPDDQQRLLHHAEQIPVGPQYVGAYLRWVAALQESGAVTAIVETTSRLLIGHGNEAPGEVGLTLHHTYGVPILPGSALKGLLNHYLATWGGAQDERWRGVGYDLDTGRPSSPPGAWHGTVFGAPAIAGAEERDVRLGRRGGVVFEDAWLVPDTAAEFPLCADVLTPHQGDYYRKFGGTDQQPQPPNDWTDPIPVTFLTAKTRLRFLLALDLGDAGRPGAELAIEHLQDALERLGLGAKTRAGYGRFKRVTGPDRKLLAQAESGSRGTAQAPQAQPMSEPLSALQAAVHAFAEPNDADAKLTTAERFDKHIKLELLDALGPTDKPRAREILKPITQHGGLKRRRKAEMQQITEKLA